MSRLGVRNASYRPARSVARDLGDGGGDLHPDSVGAFRRDGSIDWSDPPLGHRRLSAAGRNVLPLANRSRTARTAARSSGLDQSDDIFVEPFRAAARRRCELPEPVRSRASRACSASGAISSRKGRFAFAGTLDGAERDNPWRLLEREQDDGAIPVIGDANSMTYVLHKSIGDEIVVDRGGASDPAEARRDAVRQHLPERAADVGSQLPAAVPGPGRLRLLLVDAPADRSRGGLGRDRAGSDRLRRRRG